MSFLALPVEAIEVGAETAGIATEAVGVGAEAGATMGEAGTVLGDTGEVVSEAGDTEGALREAVDLVEARGVQVRTTMSAWGGVQLSVKFLGTQRTRRDLDRMHRRMLNIRRPLAAITTGLLAAERAKFAGLGGRFVNTGRLRASLTQTAASGAVREIGERRLKFGTGVPYARFQVEHPGPVTPAGGLRRPPPSAVMVRFSIAERQAISRAILHYIVGGHR